LDLVISVTTAVVHLAGALGKEVWCLAPNKPRWFYRLEGDPLWYRSVKMFRQTQEWPIKDVVKMLQLRWGK
jgi:ADP-heptose:LPS heptosyltransferase